MGFKSVKTLLGYSKWLKMFFAAVLWGCRGGGIVVGYVKTKCSVAVLLKSV
ncbi:MULTISPECIES: hypothetical protein [Helicobacter]|uniref:hypothetical protein n=1 Tax=Helicobacter TaxID=209 RepID=UPI002620D444|nr:hypothetical protein [Helicobacter sp. UBA3407]